MQISKNLQEVSNQSILAVYIPRQYMHISLTSHVEIADFPVFQKVNSSSIAQLQWKAYDKKWEAIKSSPVSDTNVPWEPVV